MAKGRGFPEENTREKSAFKALLDVEDGEYLLESGISHMREECRRELGLSRKNGSGTLA
jgi:hypothetical protein